MPKISLLLPTRGRPLLVQRFFQSLMAQTANPTEIEVVLYVDEDDVESHHLNCNGVGFVRIIGPRLSMGAYNQTCLNRSSGDIVILMNDDVVIRTPGWDRAIAGLAAEVPDGIFLAYANDLHFGAKLCTFPIISRKICQVVAKPYPEEYQSWFIDRHILDVFRRLQYMGQDRIFYLDQVVFEHLHFDYGKAELDPTYQIKGRYQDDWTFVSLRDLRQATAERLYAAIVGRPLPDLRERPSLPISPQNTFLVLLRYASAFLLDFDLPISERVQLFAWMAARHFRYRGYLPPRHAGIHQD